MKLLQESLLDDLKYCRVLQDQVEDLARLLYFIERKRQNTTTDELNELFEKIVSDEQVDFT